jgi:hypothetical protein
MGSRLRAPMPRANASFTISRKAGRKPIVHRPALQKKPQPATADQPEQYQLFDTPQYTYRVFVTNMRRAIDLLVWFYDQRAGAVSATAIITPSKESFSD